MLLLKTNFASHKPDPDKEELTNRHTEICLQQAEGAEGAKVQCMLAATSPLG